MTKKDLKHILVTGASGFTGTFVVASLLREGHNVTAFVRSPDKGIELRGRFPELGISIGSFEQPSTLSGAMENVDAVINVASLGFGHVESIVQCIKENGLDRAIFFSSTSIFTTLPAESKKVRIKAEDVIRRSELSWTIFRPTMIYGTPGDRNIIRLIRWIDKHRFVPVFGPGSFRMQPVYVCDLANAVVCALGSPITIGKEYNLSGADVVTYNKLVNYVGELLGRRPWLIHVPVSLSLACVDYARHIPGLPKLTREQVLRLNEHKDFSHTNAVEDFGYHTTSIREALACEIEMYRS